MWSGHETTITRACNEYQAVFSPFRIIREKNKNGLETRLSIDEHLFCFVQESILCCLGSIRKVTKRRAHGRKFVPPDADGGEATSGRGIISIPNLDNIRWVAELVDQRDSCESIHGHCEWVSLGGTLLGMKDNSIDKQLRSLTIEVDKNG